MTEKLDFVGYQREAGHELAGVGDQMLPLLKRQSVLFEPVFQLVGPREHPNARAFLEAMPRLLAPYLEGQDVACSAGENNLGCPAPTEGAELDTPNRLPSSAASLKRPI